MRRIGIEQIEGGRRITRHVDRCSHVRAGSTASSACIPAAAYPTISTYYGRIEIYP
jgi:hypothetical protein